jgi:hypothetical protein
MKSTIKINQVVLSMAIAAACSCSCSKKGSSPTTPPVSPTAEFTVSPGTVLVTGFAGFGTQYNQNVYAAISASDGITSANVGQLETKVKALHSQYVRIFFDSKAWPTDPNYSTATADFMSSFVSTVKLAQDAGATSINITYWHTAAAALMPAFAGVLNDLIVNHGLTAVNQVTIQNEVNSTAMTMDDYKACYTSLDQALKTLGIRNNIKFVGGDLVETNQQIWFSYMAANMSDQLAGYSSHIYWNDNDAAKPVTRLSGVAAIVNALGTSIKPMYITEYGVRGSVVGTGITDPGELTSTTTPISQTTTAALENALFQLDGLNLGFAGFSRWDCYKAKYDGGEQLYSCIGSGTNGYPLYPLYYMTCLFTRTSQAGWNVVKTAQGTNASEVVAALQDNTGKDMTLYAVNKSNGAYPFVIGGLPATKSFHVLAWNNDQKGKIAKLADVTTDGKGVLQISLPAQSAVAVTTLTADISDIP